METLSVCSDHSCRAMRCRIREVTVVMGEMDVDRVIQYRFCQGQPTVHSTPPANGGHPMPGGDTRSATYPVDCVQPGPDYVGNRGMGDDVWRSKKRDLMRPELAL